MELYARWVLKNFARILNNDSMHPIGIQVPWRDRLHVFKLYSQDYMLRGKCFIRFYASWQMILCI
jgi:hypothetical protein